MHIDLTRLKKNLEKEISIDLTYSFSKEELKATEIIELNDVKIIGTIKKNALEEMYLDITISGTMYLPCAITLKKTPYPFTTKIEGNIEELLEEIGKIDKKVENTIDIFPIIWENIVMEIPTRIVSPNAVLEKQEGDGWKVITDYNKTGSNPEFEKLKELLKKEV